MKMNPNMERRNTHTLGYAWKLLVVFMVLLSIAKSTEITEEVVAKTIAKYLVISREDKSINIEDLTIAENLCKKIECVENLYYIDLENTWFKISAQKKRPCASDWKQLEEVLERVGGIRGWDIHIQNVNLGSPMPFKIVKMLIERAVAIGSLRIDVPGTPNEIADMNPALESHEMEDNISKVAPNSYWKETTPLSVYVQNSLNVFLDYVLKHHGTRELDMLCLENTDIKELDLKKINIHKECSIFLENLHQIRRIAFPEDRNIECKNMVLKRMSQPIEIIGLYKFLSTNKMEDLHLDDSTFKKFEEAYKKDAPSNEVQLLKITNLCLSNMPDTPSEKESLFCSPWALIHSRKVHVRGFGSPTIATDNKDIYPSEILEKMGISSLERCEDDILSSRQEAMLANMLEYIKFAIESRSDRRRNEEE